MRATCSNCGGTSDVILTHNGFTYSNNRGAIVGCSIVREAEKNGGSTDNTDCEHMMRAAEAVAQLLRGR